MEQLQEEMVSRFPHLMLLATVVHIDHQLNFTKVKLSKTALVPTNMYSFTYASDVFNDFYNNYLVGK
jgi:hypothetical protein